MPKDYSVNPTSVNGYGGQSTDIPVSLSPDGSGNSSRGQARITCPPTIVSDIDTLHVSLWLEWLDHSFIDRVEEKKLTVQQTSEKSLPFIFWGISWNVYRTGNSNFPFHLSIGDIHLFLNRRDPEKSFPTAKIEIGSSSCWIPGAFESFNKIIRFLQVQGATVITEKVNRVDLACDCIGLSIRDSRVDYQDLWVTRAHKFSIHFSHRKVTGVNLGQGNLMLRIYDKVAELKEKQATAKQEFFSEIWGFKNFDDKPVTRVEFQLRREILNKFQDETGKEINTVKELMFSQKTLWEYCTTKWARQSDKPVDRKNKNQYRVPISAFWKLVSSAEFAGTHVLYRCNKSSKLNVKALRDQIRGCLMSVTASLGHDVNDISGIVSSAREIVMQDLESFFTEDYSLFYKRFGVKQNNSLGWVA